MKKLFLTSGLVVCCACPAFSATDLPSSGNPSCTYTYLDSYTGPVAYEAKWKPAISGAITLDSKLYFTANDAGTAPDNSANLLATVYSKYNDNLYQTCNCSTDVCSTPVSSVTVPTKTGYLFDGYFTQKVPVCQTLDCPDPTGMMIDDTGSVLAAAKTQVGTACNPATWYAHWTAQFSDVYYTCGTEPSGTFNSPGGCNGANDCSDSAMYNTQYTMQTNAGDCSLTGYHFNGWTCDYDLFTGTHSNTSYSATLSNGVYTVNQSGTYKVAQPSVVDAQVICDAHWSPNSCTNQITYTLNNGTHGSSHPADYTYDAAFNVSNPSKTGYSFGGWTISGLESGITHYSGTTSSSLSQNALSSATTDTWFKNLRANCGAVTFTANWDACTHAISYTLNDGSFGTSHPTSATYDTAFNVSNPSKTGYSFDGWDITGMANGVAHYKGSASSSLTSAGTGTSLSDVTDTWFKNLAVCNGSVTFTAGWTPCTYTISYNLYDGSFGTSHPTSATYDTAFEVSHPTKTGYTFTGWDISGLENGVTHYRGTSSNSLTSVGTGTDLADEMNTWFKNFATCGGNVTFGAAWGENECMDQITYVLNGGTHGTSHPNDYIYDTPFNVSNPSKSGYTFAGWTISGLENGITHYKGSASNSLTSAGTGTSLSGVTDTWFKNPRANCGAVTFTAQWDANTYSITFDCGTKPTGASTNIVTGTSITPISVTYNASFTAPNTVTPTSSQCRLDGYHFNTWSCTNGITPDGHNSSNGTTYNVAGGTVCHATWTPNEVDLTWYPDVSTAQGGNTPIDVDGTNADSCIYDAGITPAPEPSKNGYTFNGWRIRL